MNASREASASPTWSDTQPPGYRAHEPTGSEEDRRRPSFFTMAPNVGPLSSDKGGREETRRDTGYETFLEELPDDRLHRMSLEERYVTGRRVGWSGLDNLTPDGGSGSGGGGGNQGRCRLSVRRIGPSSVPFVDGQVAETSTEC
jgi:hypothetical protein